MIEALIGDLTLSELLGETALIALIVSTLFEIAPIKWNPISVLLAWLGKKMNSQVLERVRAQDTKIDALDGKIDALDEKIDMNEIDHIRWEILNFANECRNERRHTKDEFDHIINLHGKYENIIESRHMTNGLIDIEFKYIEDLYRKCMESNSFL